MNFDVSVNNADGVRGVVCIICLDGYATLSLESKNLTKLTKRGIFLIYIKYVTLLLSVLSLRLLFCYICNFAF